MDFRRGDRARGVPDPRPYAEGRCGDSRVLTATTTTDSLHRWGQDVGQELCKAGLTAGQFTEGAIAPSAGHRPRRAGRVKGGTVRGPRAPHSTVAPRCPLGTLDPTTTTSRAASTRKSGRSRVRATGVRYGRTVHGQPRPCRGHVGAHGPAGQGLYRDEQSGFPS